MADQVIRKAQNLSKQKKFSAVISLLEPHIVEYRDSCDFYYLLGVACMYTGDIGGAQDYLLRASELTENNAKLLVALGSLYLRRGDTSNAVESYLNALELDPNNRIAKTAMQFIRTKGDMATISQWVASGRIKQFYPELGVYIPWVPIASSIGLALFIFLLVLIIPKLQKPKVQRADLSALELSSDDKRNPIDTRGGVYTLMLTSNEITQAYNTAIDCFEKGRDNAAQVEINRILNSNASSTIRANARELMAYLKEPSFDTIKDSYPYLEVAKEPYLYQDCWVVWSGRVGNVQAGDSLYACDFVVGYDTMKKIDGIVPMTMMQPVSIDEERPVKILAQIDVRDKKIFLHGKTVYQPISGGTLGD